MGKENTQKIESKPSNLRTRIKRLVRRTIGFAKTTTMHSESPVRGAVKPAARRLAISNRVQTLRLCYTVEQR